jgi:hypothetical protein
VAGVEAGGEPGVYFFGGALEGRLVFGAKHVRPKENVCRKVNGVWSGEKVRNGGLQALVLLEVSRLESLRDIVRVLGGGEGGKQDERG